MTRTGQPSMAPYEGLDANIAPLVYLLNEFRAVETMGSCGGHVNPGPTQKPAGRWFVTFRIAATGPEWRTLPFLMWAAQEYRVVCPRGFVEFAACHSAFENRTSGRISFPHGSPFAPRTRYRAIWYAFDGFEADAELFAEWLRELKRACYDVPAEE